ncbi:elafin [Hipposideros larvatus]
MRSSSLLILAVFLVLGTLAAQAAVVGASYKGQEAGKGRVPVKGQKFPQDEVQYQYPGKGQGSNQGRIKPGSCPMVIMRCAMMNPPNACMRDTECPGARKCCVGSCGKACMNPL